MPLGKEGTPPFLFFFGSMFGSCWFTSTLLATFFPIPTSWDPYQATFQRVNKQLKSFAHGV